MFLTVLKFIIFALGVSLFVALAFGAFIRSGNKEDHNGKTE
jgi:hypothetical protein